jgi:D-alanyl-D-alanine dipeptidase/carboxypeptidase
MTEKNLTLEEYTAFIKRFPFNGGHLRFDRGSRGFEVCYLPVLSEREVSLDIPDGVPCQVSGNNEDGVVLTLWSAV